MNEVAGSRARCELAIRTPAHFAYAGQHVRDGLLLAMMVNSRASAGVDLEHAAPHRRFDAELRRNGGQAFRAGRLQCPLSEFRRVNNADCGGVAHRLNWVRRSKACDFDRGFASELSRAERKSLSYVGRRVVRWLRELKRWYGPNASTFLEAMDLDKQLHRRARRA